MKIENFIVTGCSFTSGVFKCNTNLQSAQTYWEQNSYAWPHFAFADLGVYKKNFFNFALPGGGNIAAMTNLVLFLEKNPHINHTNTLIGINITELSRIDYITDKNDPQANRDAANKHIIDHLNIGWITGQIQNYKLNLEYQTAAFIIQTLTYLESKNIQYFFMLMTDSIYNTSPEFFQNFLHLRRKKWITFDSYKGMENFVIDKKTIVSNNDTHPNKEGHKIIAAYVTEHLRNPNYEYQL